ncbi:unnamed protein product [Brachionus calyciflorus]|uniref:Uncharacterized protein n=1 Tax=Brachionus calyciflorus TaxID=104777 RepID=A0A814LET1_9BILA|nr:unnamed protein product [Brachionus calyciflorus]
MQSKNFFILILVTSLVSIILAQNSPVLTSNTISLVFRLNQKNILTCTYNKLTFNLQCIGPFTSINCASKLEVQRLEKIFFETFIAIPFRIVRYKVFPFSKIQSSGSTIIYDYTVPIYVPIYPVYTITELNQIRILDLNENICYNSLIAILNESSLFSNIQIVPNF